MSPRFEEVVVFAVICILVTLFGWIYALDRQKRIALWMLGWLAIFIHFAAPAIDDWLPWLMPYTNWIKAATLILAGTCFLLSVSDVFVRHRRIAFMVFISGTSMCYLCGLQFGIRSPWFYAGLLGASGVYGLIQALRYYNWKTPHLFLLVLLFPYCGWAIEQALKGRLDTGLDFYLFSFFYITGLVYFRHFRRISPGVIFPSASFIAWGCVFPAATVMSVHHSGPAPGSF